jgi:Na+-translocating ferredoxin:NAD+ oxidoreductase subunit A
MSSLLLILLSAVVANLAAIALVREWRPLANTSDVYLNAMGMARAHLLAVPAVTVVSWLLAAYALEPLGLTFLRTPVLVAVVLAVVPCVDTLLRRRDKFVPSRPAFSILLSASSAVLGVALVSEQRAASFAAACLLALLTAIVFGLLLLASATLHERLRYADVPAPFRDAPITLIMAGLMALGFMGFTGLIQE